VKVSAWLIDLDGTLYRSLPVKLAMAMELALTSRRTRKSVLVFRQEHVRLRKEQSKPVASPYRLQMERAARRLGIDPEELEPLIAEWMIRRPTRWLAALKRDGLLEEIADFRALGGKTALVSDYPALQKLRALGAEAYFDVVIANGEAGGPERLKPHADGYLLAAAQLGVSPEQCLVIGDRDDADGVAARHAKMAFRLIR
jgi:HAD superfamily hydrolase (TIGR01549 family)